MDGHGSSPTQHERTGEDDHGLCKGEGSDTKQEILQPGDEQIMDEIDAICILRQAVDQRPAPRGEAQGYRHPTQARASGAERKTKTSNNRQARQAPTLSLRPKRPAPWQDALRPQQSLLQARCANTDPCEEIDGVKQGKAGLKGEGAELDPLPRLKGGRRRDVNHCRDARESNEIPAGIFAGSSRYALERLTQAWSKPA